MVPSVGWSSIRRATVTIIGRTDDSRHTHSLAIAGAACGFRKGMTETVDLQLNSRQIFQKEKDVGGIAASDPTMHPRKRSERFISVKRLCSRTSETLHRHREELLTLLPMIGKEPHGRT
jgi:hypothetical protein